MAQTLDLYRIEGSIKVCGCEREDWLANREGAWLRMPYECFWSKVGMSRKSQG